MKKRLKKIKNWIKKRKYYLLGFFLILFIWWYNCLPTQLFNTPTSTILLDSKGDLLNAQIAEDGQWRFPYNDSVPQKFKDAIVQFEDKTYYSHIGVSFRGIARAIKQNISEGRVVSGGSTITMQVIRMARNKNRTIYQKLVEMIWATRLDAKFTKEKILAIYASNAPMGGNVVGLDAASWRYFQRSPSDLSWAETAMLAVLPNAPSLIHLGKNREKLKNKRNRLLDKLFVAGKIDKETLEISKEEPLPNKPKPLPQITPHLLAKAISNNKKGKRIKTTIDKSIQNHVIKTLDIHHNRLKQNNIFNGAVIVCDIKSGKILAYVGNTNVKEKEHSGSVDIISSPRSSGSILKPFLYASILEEGEITPDQVIPDIPTSMAGYSPENYNQKYVGIVPAGEALSKSLNVPFIRMLRDYGNQKFHSKLQKIGMTTLTKPASHYGLSLILGGCEVKLIDLMNMYGKMARTLNQFPAYDSSLNFNFIYTDLHKKVAKEPIVDPSAIWFTFQAMKKVVRPNKEKNWETFSSSQKIAWKTGTSYGFRDAWAVGLNSQYIVGVWVGNADGEGRPGIIGVEAAAPILFDVFDILPKSNWFAKPLDKMEMQKICVKSGYKASDICTEIREELVPETENSSLPCPYHINVFLDKTEKYRVTSKCYSVSEMIVKPWFSLPPKIDFYYKKRTPNHQSLPPYKSNCVDLDNISPLSIIYPKNESKIKLPKTVEGEKGKIVLEATHRENSGDLYWHLDENFIGITNHIHQMELKISVGKHTLLVMDELGNSKKVEFLVVKN